jgi:hypothetical protein
MTIYVWAEYLYELFMFSALIPVFIGLRKWQRLTPQQRWLLGCIIVLLVHEIIGEITIRLHIRNHFLYPLQTVGMVVCLAGAYDGLVGRPRVLWGLAGAIVAMMVMEVVFWVGIGHINSITLTLSRLLAAFCAFLYLKRLFSANSSGWSAVPASDLFLHLGVFVFGAFTAAGTYFKSYFIDTSLDLYYLFDLLSGMFCAISFGFFTVGLLRIRSTTTLTS